MRAARLERGPQRRALAEQVLLAGELAQRPRTHARRERPVLGRALRAGLLRLEQRVHEGTVPCSHGLAGRGGRRPRAADPVRHGQPARQRARMPGVAQGLPGGRGPRVRAPPRRRRRAAQPRRPSHRRGRGTRARLPLPRRHRPRRRVRLAARPLVGRGPRRRDLGPRRRRHEVPDRGGGRRGRPSRAQRLAPAPRRGEADRRRRRGDRRGARRAVAHRAAARRRTRRLARQRGRRRGDALRRPPPLRRLLRGEGHVPLPRPRPRPRRARVRPRARRQRAAQAPARTRAPRRRPRRLRRGRGAARAAGRARRGPAGPRAARSRNVRATDPMLAALVEPTLGTTFAPTIISAGTKINVIPGARGVRRGLPAAARPRRRCRDRARDGAARRRRRRARARLGRGHRRQPLAAGVSAHGRDRRLGRPRRSRARRQCR